MHCFLPTTTIWKAITADTLCPVNPGPRPKSKPLPLKPADAHMTIP